MKEYLKVFVYFNLVKADFTSRLSNQGDWHHKGEFQHADVT